MVPPHIDNHNQEARSKKSEAKQKTENSQEKFGLEMTRPLGWLQKKKKNTKTKTKNKKPAALVPVAVISRIPISIGLGAAGYGWISHKGGSLCTRFSNKPRIPRHPSPAIA